MQEMKLKGKLIQCSVLQAIKNISGLMARDKILQQNLVLIQLNCNVLLQRKIGKNDVFATGKKNS